MKVIYIALLFFGNVLFALEELDTLSKAEIQSKVMQKLLRDEIAREQFLFQGKMSCYKYLKIGNEKEFNYDLNWLRGGVMNFPIFSIIKPQNIIDYFNKDISTRIQNKHKELSLRAEPFYNVMANGAIICESLHRVNDENIKRYNEFIRDLDNYQDYSVYKFVYIGYLKDDIYNNDFW
ncbi:MAG: hypothetical protein KU37_05985 [Sulfuricurvum sp. PC08-66]|nr:MAG: hypothetical protein KU37_05985 [Sulfuricurvum sp. PC08-66]